MGIIKKKKAIHRRAIGLAYEGSNAPTVAARGMHLNADEIVKIAKRHGVPVVERADLTRVLDQVEVDEEIPADLYEAVATILHQIDSKEK